MGQVWSSADFDGIRERGHEGGTGSPLAVTAQNFGLDGVAFTPDDILAPLNQIPVPVSLDNADNANCADREDSVRSFLSFHSGGAFFVFGDGSVRFVEQSIAPRVYLSQSTIADGEVVP